MKNRYFASSSSSSKNSKAQKSSFFEKDDDDTDRPDPKRRDFYYDDVDEFHNAKEKVYLDKAKAVDSNSSDEEIYKIGADEDDNEEAEEEDDDIDMQSDIEDKNEDYLPSANAWGKNRKTFYNTDYVDKDYGGLSESDEEAAQLEETEARNMQKRMAEQMNEDDFRLELPNLQTGQQPYIKKSEEQDVDVNKMNDNEKLELLYSRNPELSSLIQEYREKTLIVEKQLKPVVERLKNGTLPSTKPLNFIRLRFEAYMNYLLNLHFYFILKASHISVQNHPVIDRIMEWKKIVTRVDKKCASLEEDLNILCKKLSNDDDLSTIKFVDDSECSSVGKSIKSKTNVKTKLTDEESVENEDDEFYDFEEQQENTKTEQDEKRAATYEILKNKGTTPKRKKENRNPRVKHRKKFEKALHKKRSQVPDVRRELYKYGGEERGIKPNLVKSVKLH